MSQINKFYLKQATYQIEIAGQMIALLMDYSGNKYEVIGPHDEKIDEIATKMLKDKHGVNFAYKFDAKMKEGKI